MFDLMFGFFMTETKGHYDAQLLMYGPGPHF